MKNLIWLILSVSIIVFSSLSCKDDITAVNTSPDIPTPYLPADSATEQPLPITLKWKASSGATAYHLQVATDTLFKELIFDNTVKDTLQQISGLFIATTYYWHVQAHSSNGESAYSKKWNFKTLTAPPGIPELCSPASGSNNQTANPILSWHIATNASSYTLQVASDSAFTSIVYNQSGLTDTVRQISGLKASSTYFWRVMATNTFSSSSFSSVRSFTTIAVPSSPTLLTPITGAINQPLSLKFSWAPVAGAVSYILQVSTDSSFKIITFNSSVTDTSTLVSNLDVNTKYYWRANATNGGGTSVYSLVRNFTTTPTPNVPTLDSPYNERSVTVSEADNFYYTDVSWIKSQGATSYTLQVSVDSSFSTFVFNQSGLTSLSQKITGLTHGLKYYWRVRAANTYASSEFSTIWYFVANVQKPYFYWLTEPASGSTLRWKKGERAKAYTLVISPDGMFTDTAYVKTAINDTVFTVPDNFLKPSTQYYWKVCATNEGGASDFPDSWTFSTYFTKPTIISPANGAMDLSVAPKLSWNNTVRSEQYLLEVSTDPAFTTLFLSNSPSYSSSKVVWLNNHTTYYWRIRGYNSLDTSEYSDTYSLTTNLTSFPEMIDVDGGTYTMGDGLGTGNNNERPTHQVTVSSFKMQKTETTIHQWDLILNNSNVFFTYTGNEAITYIKWSDIYSYCNRLSEAAGFTPCYSINGNTNPGNWTNGAIVMSRTGGYRLPTEAEWEFAARGGTKSHGYLYSGSDTIDNVAWYHGNNTGTIKEVALKVPNELGLYDMTGNAEELCCDDYAFYTSAPALDPNGLGQTPYAVKRGGSFMYASASCTVSARGSILKSGDAYSGLIDIGFRVVQDIIK
jgi:formylglycine-generating enzyme required for sulfatase activity